MFVKVIFERPEDPKGFALMECRGIRALEQHDDSWVLILDPGEVECRLTSGSVAFIMNDEGKTIDKILV